MKDTLEYIVLFSCVFQHMWYKKEQYYIGCLIWIQLRKLHVISVCLRNYVAPEGSGNVVLELENTAEYDIACFWK